MKTVIIMFFIFATIICSPIFAEPLYTGWYHLNDDSRHPLCYQKFDITVRNNTSHVINFAIRYKDGQDWLVRGWWSLDPGESANLGKLTDYPDMYLYAECEEGKVWGGQFNAIISDPKLSTIRCEGNRTVGFDRVHVPFSCRLYTYTFVD